MKTVAIYCRVAYSGKSERQFRDIGTAFRFKQNE